MKESLLSLKKDGFWCAGLAEEGQDINSFLSEKKVVYVLGSENKGIRPLVRKHCDSLIRIPTNAHFSTLNVSHACAIILAQRFSHTKA